MIIDLKNVRKGEDIAKKIDAFIAGKITLKEIQQQYPKLGTGEKAKEFLVEQRKAKRWF